MIIDSHAYTFEAADSLMGYDSVDEHLRWVQAGQASHHQPAFSLSDRSRGSSEVLAPGESDVLTGLPDVDFRIDHAAGRVVWTVDGEDYTKHYYPPNLQGCAFGPDSLISEMDYAGVGHGAPAHEPDARSQQRLPSRVHTQVPRQDRLDGARRRMAYPRRYRCRDPRA